MSRGFIDFMLGYTTGIMIFNLSNFISHFNYETLIDFSFINGIMLLIILAVDYTMEDEK